MQTTLAGLGTFVRNLLLFTCSSFVAASATAFVLSDAEAITLTRMDFMHALLKAFAVGVVVSVVLVGRDVHNQRRMRNAGTHPR